RGCRALRPDVRRHRHVRGARLCRRPYPDDRARLHAARPDDRHDRGGGAMRAALLRHVERWYSIPLLLLMWQAAVSSGLVESRLLPGFGRVAAALIRDTGNGVLPYHTAITLAAPQRDLPSRPWPACRSPPPWRARRSFATCSSRSSSSAIRCPRS